MNQTEKAKRSPWFWLLFGCGGLIVLSIAGVVVLWNVSTRKFVRAVEENAKNPALRAEKAKRMLGASRLPDGYYPVSGTFEMPIVTHVSLYDRPPDDTGSVLRFDNRGFVFTATLYTDSSKRLEGFFSGAPGAPETIEKIGVKIRVRENLTSGSMDIGNEEIRYRIVRGRIEQGESEAEVPMALMWIDCPGEKKERYAVWFGPQVTDQAAVRGFMSQFDLCRTKRLK